MITGIDYEIIYPRIQEWVSKNNHSRVQFQQSSCYIFCYPVLLLLKQKYLKCGRLLEVLFIFSS